MEVVDRGERQMEDVVFTFDQQPQSNKRKLHAESDEMSSRRQEVETRGECVNFSSVKHNGPQE